MWFTVGSEYFGWQPSQMVANRNVWYKRIERGKKDILPRASRELQEFLSVSPDRKSEKFLRIRDKRYGNNQRK